MGEPKKAQSKPAKGASIALSVSRRTRATPFTSRVEAGGVRGYTVYNHMMLPTVFRGVVEDYHHLCAHVQVWDVGCERQVEIAGPDAARLVQLMTPRDLTNATVGQCLYAPLVDEAGGLVNDPVVLKLAADRYWLSIADSDVLLWAKGLAHGMRLDVRVTEPDVWPLAIQGPKADTLAARVLGDAVTRLKFFRFGHFDFRGHSFLVARSGWSKQGGFEVYVDDATTGQALWDALFAAGTDLDVGHGCPNLIERIEGGLLSYGNDMTLANNPLECGLDRYCQLGGSHQFLGREALTKIAAAGPKRLIRGLRLAGPCPKGTPPWPVVDGGGRRIGELTSAAESPRHRATLAFAMLDRSHAEPGGKVTVMGPAGAIAATVSVLPFGSDGAT